MRVTFNFKNIRLAIQMHWVLLGSSLAFALYFFLLAQLPQCPQGVVVAHYVMVTVSLLAGLLGVFYWNALRINANIWVLTLYLHFSYVAAITGGLQSNAMIWLAFLPSATLLLGTASTLFWVSCSTGVMLGLAVAQHLGWIRSQVLTSEHAWWSMGMTSGAILGICLLITIYEKLNDDHTNELLKQRKILEDTQLKLIKARDHKDEFIAVVSHELRTPMNAIVGFTELLKNQVSDKLLSLLSYVQLSAQQLLSVISDILIFSQLQANKLQLVYDEVNLSNLLNTAIVNASKQAHAKALPIELQIQAGCPTTFWGDELRLGQILDQLLNNAIKFTETGKVQLIVSVIPKGIRIEIKDTGLGIASDEMHRIFMQFEHGNSEIQKRFGGTGLGLSICQKMIELHRGQIGVASELNLGSTFWLELPIHFETQLPQKNTSHTALNTLPPRQNSTNQWGEFIRQKLHTIPSSYDGKSNMYLIYVVMLLFTAFVYAYTSPSPEVTVANYCFTAVLVSAVVLQLLNISLKTVVNGVLAIACIHLIYITSFFGGVASIGTNFLILIPLTPFYLFSARSRLFWFSAAIASDGVISYLTAHHMVPVPPGAETNSIGWTLLNLIPLIGLIIFFPSLYKSIRKKTRLSLIQQNTQLKITREALVTQEQLKNQFIGNVSHELRTPMNAIIGFNNLLGEQLRDNKETQELHSFVSQAARHLMTVIDDMLDYSQLESGTIHFKVEPIDLHQIIRNALFMFKSSINQDKIKLELEINDTPQWTQGDGKRLTQILVNLLSNAIKFTNEGEIRLASRRHSAGIVFTVSDTGCGISEEKLSAIFGEFEQASTTTTHRTKGHGLGLAITKRLVEAQNGNIKVTSQLGKGSQFTCWLPYLETQKIIKPHVSTTDFKTSETQLKILVVDDHQLNRVLVRQIIQRVWPNTLLHEAINGQDAIDKHLECNYDIILMDMIMPELDGVAATKIIREKLPDPQCQTPILGLTANANDQAKNECLDCGMNDIIYKPFDQSNLLAQIKKLTQSEIDQTV